MPLIADTLRNLSAALVTSALAIAAIVLGRDILVPLTLAGLSCFILVPIVIWLNKRGIPHGFAESIVLICVVGFLSAASFGLSSQLLSLAADLPAYRTNVLDKVRSFIGPSVPSGMIGRAIDAVESYQQMINTELQLGEAEPSATPPANAATDKNNDKKVQVVEDRGESTALYGLKIMAEPLTQAGLTFFFTLFLLMQYRDLRDRVVRIFGVDHMTDTTAAMSDAGERLSALFSGQVILNASFGTFVGIALLVIGVPNAPLWGVVAFIMRFVPFLGSYIAAVPPILLAAAVDPGWTKAILTLCVFAVGEPIMGQILEPLVLGRRAGLSPFAMVLATSFWTLMWGPIGLILAAPITIVLVVLGKYVPDLQFITVLLGDEPPLSESQDLYHRLLAGDAFAATEQIEKAEESNSSFAEALDALVFPAVALGARDMRRGRLDKEGLAELRETIDAVVENTEQSPEREDAQIVVVPMRGAIDEAAAQFAVEAINRSCPDLARGVSGASGLTALASLTDQNQSEIREIILFTISRLGDGIVRILTERARALFPGVDVSILDVSHQKSDFEMAGSAKTPSAKMPKGFTSIANLVSILDCRPSRRLTPVASHAAR